MSIQGVLLSLLAVAMGIWCLYHPEEGEVEGRSIVRVVTSHQQREGGGFLVRKVIGAAVPTCDPFLMLDHLGPVVYGPGEALGAPDHPHRGFETVTYVIDGGVKHKDSAGNKGTLSAGWVQWMTAGSGVVHSEMPSDELMKKGGRMEGFQLWVNLPSKLKMISPRYQDVPPERLPVVEADEGRVKVKVIAGHAMGAEAVIETRTQILMLDVQLAPGASFSHAVPQGFNGFVYVWRGAGFAGEDMKSLSEGQVGIIGSIGSALKLKAENSQEMRALLIAGEPIKETIVKYGPFVMNTEEEIEKAISDYREGKLGSIPGKDARMQQTENAQAMQKKNGAWK